ncbi:MAG: Omp28-related outer membrane protein [Saprospiraceae bacterium]
MKIFAPLLVCLFISSVGFGQYVSDKRQAFVVKRTATWCGPCGTWGWSLWADLMNDSSLPPFAAAQVHDSQSSRLNVPIANDLTSFYEVNTGVPNFYIGSTNQTQSSGGGISPAATLARLKDLVRAYSRIDAEIGVGYTATLTDNVVDIKGKVKAFSDINGEYYLGVYILEKDVVEYQNPIGDDAVHKTVLRDAVTPNGYGDLIQNGAIGAGTEFDYTYSYTVPQGFNAENVRLAMVIWKKENGEYSQESAYSVRESLVSSTEQAFEDLAELTVFTNAEGISYSIAPKQSGDLKVDLVNVSGQVVQPLFFGGVDQPMQRNFTVSGLAAGIYFVRSNFGGTIKTETVRF